MTVIRELVDKALNWSGGAYVGLSTLVILCLAVAEFASGIPVVLYGADGKAVIYMTHRAPEWFVNSIGVYTIILTVFALSKPINTLVTQKGQAAGITPPDAAKGG